MIRRAPRSVGGWLAVPSLVLAATACGPAEDPEEGSALEVRVTATLAAEPYAPSLEGTVVIELSLPEGEPSRAVALESLTVGGNALRPDEIDGLREFPSELAGGESVRVELAIGVDALERGTEDGYRFPDPVCGGAEELVVDVRVLDAESTSAGASVGAAAREPVQLRSPEPAPFAVRRVIDLGVEAAAVAADPSRDDELLVGSGGRVARVGPDGASRWSVDLTGQVRAVGRGGGVDVVLAALHGAPPCEPVEGVDSPFDDAIVAAVDDAGIAWCALLPQPTARVAVGDDGVVAVAVTDLAGETGALHRFGTDGTPLAPIALPAPAVALVSVGESFVAVTTHPWTGESHVAVVVGDDVQLAPWSAPLWQLSPRRDGTVGFVDERAWRAFDPGTGTTRRIALLPTGIVGSPAIVLEPEESDVVRVGHAGRPGADLTTLVAERATPGGATWRGTLACEDAWPIEVPGADGEALVAIATGHLVLDGVEIVAPGPRRTVVVELGPR